MVLFTTLMSPGNLLCVNNKLKLKLNDEYKFDVDKSNISAIVSKINYVLANYDTCKHDFNFYRERIKKEREIFESEIDGLFL